MSVEKRDQRLRERHRRLHIPTRIADVSGCDNPMLDILVEILATERFQRAGQGICSRGERECEGTEVEKLTFPRGGLIVISPAIRK